MAETDPLYYTHTDGIATITLNQPEKRNAISEAMWVSLGHAIDEINKLPDCQLIVITGAGDHFAAGADISEFDRVYATRESTRHYTETMLNSLEKLADSERPTIAAIKGACVGGGCSIAMACDFRLAANTALFAITPSKLGLVYSHADTKRLVSLVGLPQAKLLLMTGDPVPARQAFRIGLVEDVFIDREFDRKLTKFLHPLRRVSQWSVRATKRIVALSPLDTPEAREQAMAIMLDSFEGADFKEGYRAFLEKRKADFPTR